MTLVILEPKVKKVTLVILESKVKKVILESKAKKVTLESKAKKVTLESKVKKANLVMNSTDKYLRGLLSQHWIPPMMLDYKIPLLLVLMVYQ